MNKLVKSSLNASTIMTVTHLEVHGAINITQKQMQLMETRSHYIHHKNFLNMKCELMKFSKDTAKVTTTIIIYQVFTFSTLIKKVDSEVAGW